MNEKNISNKTSNNPEKKDSFEIKKGPLLIILIGIFWLLGNLGIDWIGKIWLPIVIILIGIYALYKSKESNLK
ncbi:hypothetical protein KKC06_01160 [Patescibacteria group bacterium]|nr:hypothetical protein [Patescibacteria group bacterium]